MGCKNAKAVITTDTTSCGGGGIVGIGGGCGQGGIQVLGSYDRTVKTQDYRGTVCTEFNEPIETKTEIKM